MKYISDMHYLKSVHLSGYKTIKDLKVKLFPGLNVIIGKNGTGKSNFLNCLYNSLSFSNLENTRISGQYILLDSETNNKWTFKIINSFSPHVNKSSSILDGHSLNLKVIKDRKALYNGKINIEELTNILHHNKIKFNPIFIKHGVPRNYLLVDEPFKFRCDSVGFSDEIFDITLNENNSFFLRSFALSILIETFAKREKKDKEYTNESSIETKIVDSFKFLDSINNIIGKYSNIKEIRVSKNFNIIKDNEKKEFLVNNFYIEFLVNSKWLPYNSLSDGTKRIFHIISEVAIPSNFSFLRNKFMISNNKFPEVVLLEEPELGLHPHHLVNLLQFLKDSSSDKQIIITTHSPQVLDILEINELERIMISTLDEGSTQLSHLDKQQLKKARLYLDNEAYISDYWRYSDLEE